MCQIFHIHIGIIVETLFTYANLVSRYSQISFDAAKLSQPQQITRMQVQGFKNYIIYYICKIVRIMVKVVFEVNMQCCNNSLLVQLKPHTLLCFEVCLQRTILCNLFSFTCLIKFHPHKNRIKYIHSFKIIQ